MIRNQYALLWLAVKVVSSHAQFEFLENTKEPIPPVEVPKEDILGIMDKLMNDYGSESVEASELWKKLPMPADDYPDNLKGVLWMDQFGDYGYQNITSGGSATNEYLLTFGDAHLSKLDTKNRILWDGGPCGGAWTIGPFYHGIPAEELHSQICDVKPPGLYQFVWNEDYTVGDAYLYNQTGDLQEGGFGYSTTLVRVPDQPEGTCPPAEDATKEERNLCAKFIRVSYAQGEGANPDGFVYPVFEVVDADGVPREPYYSAFVDWMERKNTTMQYWRPLKATIDPIDAGNAFNISLTGNATDAPAPTTAAPTASAATTATSVLALLLGAAVMMV